MLVSPCGIEGPDREVLLAGRAATVARNRASAIRWSALLAFFRRRLVEQKTRNTENPHAPLTARQETVIEVGELWGMSTGMLRRELNTDNYRARLIGDTIRREVDDGVPLDAVNARISRYLLKHQRAIEEEQGDGLVCCTVRQLQNKLAYEVRRLRSADAEARFARKYAERRRRPRRARTAWAG